jgi:prepilin-type N-terminal cleavage/methylation domain-containing protein
MMIKANAVAGDGRVTNNQGFTIIELIVVMVIMGVLLTMATLSYQTIQQRTDVEQKVKRMHTDLMNIRIRAMQRGRNHFVSMPTGTTTYRIYEDTFTSPDGNGVPDMASDTLLSSQSVAPYTLVLQTAAMSPVTFNSKGLVTTQTGWVRINATTVGEYDCIFIDQIRTGMGKMNGANCDVK